MTWQTIWFFIIYAIIFVYTLLDGFDIGIGLMLPFYRKDSYRKAILKSIFPVWDGNELWLIIGGSVLFAVSPTAFSSMLGGFYPGLMFIVFAITCRAIAFEFMYNDEQKRFSFWSVFFIVASYLMSLGGMVSVGNLLVGYPLGKNGEFTGGISIFFRPYVLLTALYGMLIFSMHAIGYIISRAADDLRDLTVKKGRVFMSAGFIVCVVFIISTLIAIPESRNRILFYLGSAIMVTCITLMQLSFRFFKAKYVFILSSACIAGFWLFVGGILFPDIIKASNDPSLSITIYNGSSSVNTLRNLAIFTVIGLSFAAGYTVFIYRVFKKR
jgi:cytochrome bd ubiquinol oxidase subunit II